MMARLAQCGGDTEHCREEMVQEWLKEDKTASWEKLCRALEHMGNELEVEIIEKQYLTPPQSKSEFTYVYVYL